MEAKNKKRIILGALIGLTAITAVWLIIKATKKPPVVETPITVDPNKPTEVPANKNDDFPLRKGSEGNRVRNLQNFLRVDNTGVFDEKTETAFKNKYNGLTQMTAAAYDLMLRNTGSVGGFQINN